MLNPNFKNVVEFRHPSWWTERVYDELQRHQIIFCGMSHPNLPDPAIVVGSTLYYRFHGVPHLYLSGYSTADLDSVANAVTSNVNVKEAFIMFNNTMEGAAVQNAKAFQDIVQLVH